MTTQTIPKGWTITTLGEVAENIAYGYTESSSQEKVGPKFLRITDIQDDFISWDSVPYCPISKEDHDKYRLEIGDVVIARTGNSTGATATIKDDIDAVFASYLIRFKIDKKRADFRFIDFLLRSEMWKGFVKSVKGGSAQGGANARNFAEFPVLLPHTAEQKAIAAVLSALDDKIELLRKQNKTLESIAQTLFKRWFVDFEFPNEKGKPYKSSGGKIVGSTLGKIPAGWKWGCLADVATQCGKSVSPDELSPDTPYIGLEHMPRRSIAIDNWEGAGKVTSGKLAFQRGDYLFGKLRPYFHKVGIAPIDGICSTDIVVLRAKRPIASAFVICCISQNEFVAYTDKSSGGTKMPRTSWEQMGRFELSLPPDGLLKTFQDCTAPMLARIVANIHETRTLTALRDSLLPKLMKGELRVKGFNGKKYV